MSRWIVVASSATRPGQTSQAHARSEMRRGHHDSSMTSCVDGRDSSTSTTIRRSRARRSSGWSSRSCTTRRAAPPRLPSRRRCARRGGVRPSPSNASPTSRRSPASPSGVTSTLPPSRRLWCISTTATARRSPPPELRLCRSPTRMSGCCWAKGQTQNRPPPPSAPPVLTAGTSRRWQRCRRRTTGGPPPTANAPAWPPLPTSCEMGRARHARDPVLRAPRPRQSQGCLQPRR
mmetsp:Transcript_51161/g.109323  ORF Transcript_51161/g.109323 Transcript_51161/m.109323 type:complete len:233 (+) Transcript_51161:138-836(+)